MKFERGPARTVSNHKVTILMTNAQGDYPLIGVVHHTSGDQEASWTAKGKFHKSPKTSVFDLRSQADSKVSDDE